jgi:hypothetical protein
MSTVSQKRFVKGVNAATGVLSQQPGTLSRMSNLVLTQRGSLQVCDGSFLIGQPSVSTYLLPLWVDVFLDYSVNQFPFYVVLSQRVSPVLSNVTGVAASVSGSSTNPAGTYWFGVTAVGTMGGADQTAIVPGSSSYASVVAGSPFGSVSVTWTAVPGAAEYYIYLLSANPVGGSTFSAAVIGTASGGSTLFSFTGLLPTPSGPAPWANATEYAQLFVGSVDAGSTGTSLLWALISGGNYPAFAPQPCVIVPGDPNFQGNALVPGFSPYGGVAGVLQSVPEIVPFAGQEILVLGNGLAPQSFNPATPATSPANLTNSFTAAYPSWQATVSWITGSQMQNGGYFFTATQGGVSGATIPTFNNTKGTETADGSVIWTSQGAVATVIAPRGAAHAVSYAGSLWLANTSPQTTTDGLDGPTCIKMSDANNSGSWNPVNTAFIGKDDGTQITGLMPFTIAAVGISPTGSMAVFKEFLTYQIIGVFGSSSFEIQPAQTDMGCLAARSIQFLPGFGIVRWSHLGFAVYDGVSDRLISEEIRPYLFGGIDVDSDITPVDEQYAYLAKSSQCVQPPMYMCAMALKGNGGALTRVFCYDLILKAWAIIDLPWPIYSLNRAKAGDGNPLTIAGKGDGTLQRMQAGDTSWNGSPSSPNGTPIAWGFRTPDVFGEGSSQRMFYYQVVLRGYGTAAQAASIVATLNLDGGMQGTLYPDVVPQPVNSKKFECRFSILLNGQIAHLDISGQGQVIIDSVDWTVTAKSTTARRVMA